VHAPFRRLDRRVRLGLPCLPSRAARQWRRTRRRRARRLVDGRARTVCQGAGRAGRTVVVSLSRFSHSRLATRLAELHRPAGAPRILARSATVAAAPGCRRCLARQPLPIGLVSSRFGDASAAIASHKGGETLRACCCSAASVCHAAPTLLGDLGFPRRALQD